MPLPLNNTHRPATWAEERRHLDDPIPGAQDCGIYGLFVPRDPAETLTVWHPSEPDPDEHRITAHEDRLAGH